MLHFVHCLRWFFAGLLAGLLLVAGTAWGQGAVGFGDWQLHLPTNRAGALADAGSRVYVATDDAFVLFDKELKTIRLLSRRDGLHDVGVRTVAYDSLTQSVLVVYRNANLDVLRPDGSIHNLSDILRKQLTGEKIIYSIYFHARRAYLSGSFGLVVVDMNRLEVRDTYTNIGPGGEAVRVFATTILHDSLYAATSQGLLRGRLTDNLVDYHSWRTDTGGSGRSGEPYRTLATQEEKVYAGVNGVGLYRFTGKEWVPLAALAANQYRQLTPSAAGLLVALERNVAVLGRDGQAHIYSPDLIQNPRAVTRARNGELYIADDGNGLVAVTPDGQQATRFVTNAPETARAFSILTEPNGRVTVFTGGYGDRYLQAELYDGFYEYANGHWQNTTPRTLPDLSLYPQPKDLTRGVRTPDGTLYIGSYGNGLLEWQGPGKFRLFNPVSNQPNPLLSVIADPKFTRINDVALDAEGNVWVVNRHEAPNTSGLFLYQPATKQWTTVPYFSGAENLDRITIDDNGYAWITEARKNGRGLVVYDRKTQSHRLFTKEDGGLPALELYDVEKDRAGDIWVATIAGVAVYNDPSQVFLAGSPGLRAPIVRRGAGSGFPLLFTEVVKAIAVDGGNRKWFGTDNGLWLFNADGDEALQHFTTANSPLPSNRIVDVAVNDKTGDVFVATEAGLVSYRGSATVTEGAPSCAKVFPNPVRRNFTGQVGISGLANNAVVKITDVAGQLVYQTRASGGTVVWNLQDYNGRRVQSGVYLVLSSDADGQNGCISKVAVVEK
ncbi:T9SS type A sorting domain-containing protein [Hymenobacter sp. BT730]|uniref:type IX secretion system anionic LPS delivery protein PorZ n=1 Tax=Hymenobacter sp. BT730 TaxID=3063332 RepID=UPI0026DEA79E|nr:T9SS type A sorting domain-containing protein [Hymenobacter sp. BT730]